MLSRFEVVCCNQRYQKKKVQICSHLIFHPQHTPHSQDPSYILAMTIAIPPNRAPTPTAAVCAGTPAVLAAVETAPPALVVLAVVVACELVPVASLAPVATAEAALETPLMRLDSSDWSAEYSEPVVIVDSAAMIEEESGAMSEASASSRLLTSVTASPASLSREEIRSPASENRPERLSSSRLITGAGVTTGSRGNGRFLAYDLGQLEY